MSKFKVGDKVILREYRESLGCEDDWCEFIKISLNTEYKVTKVGEYDWNRGGKQEAITLKGISGGYSPAAIFDLVSDLKVGDVVVVTNTAGSCYISDDSRYTDYGAIGCIYRIEEIDKQGKKECPVFIARPRKGYSHGVDTNNLRLANSEELAAFQQGILHTSLIMPDTVPEPTRRFKTEKEFIEEFGEDWKGCVSYGWSSSMNALFGQDENISRAKDWSISSKMLTTKPLPKEEEEDKYWYEKLTTDDVVICLDNSHSSKNLVKNKAYKVHGSCDSGVHYEIEGYGGFYENRNTAHHWRKATQQERDAFFAERQSSQRSKLSPKPNLNSMEKSQAEIDAVVAEVKRRYPIGTKYIPLDLRSKPYPETAESIRDPDIMTRDPLMIDVGVGYVYVEGTWAEVVEEKKVKQPSASSAPTQLNLEKDIVIPKHLVTSSKPSNIRVLLEEEESII